MSIANQDYRRALEVLTVVRQRQDGREVAERLSAALHAPGDPEEATLIATTRQAEAWLELHPAVAVGVVRAEGET